MQASTQSAAPAMPEPGGALRQYLRFALGDASYAVSIDNVREILQADTMTAVPLMPGFMRGVMNLRGAVVPVVNLSERLGLHESTLGRRSCVVIVDVVDEEADTSSVIGIVVDAVYEVFELAALEPTPAFGTAIAAAHIAGMARTNQQVLAVLDLDRVLAIEELSQLVARHIGH
ncbi:chemotaxis protein CheW [Ideonella sp. A 288]|uniref:chemotaxis protein CheW n=1 Tax=Ideonella sp. A 288 TaxID=1962181 RepID=UPI000B4AF3A0|nr:chemotaxis protein CheW [Ideonella sp. A 288]